MIAQVHSLTHAPRLLEHSECVLFPPCILLLWDTLMDMVAVIYSPLLKVKEYVHLERKRGGGWCFFTQIEPN